MSKLSGKAIQAAVERGDIVIDPFDPKHLGPNSYDLRLAPEILTYPASVLDVRGDNVVIQRLLPETGQSLHPGRLYLARTIEVAGSNKYVPCIEGRSSLARLGMQVHMTAGFGDVGFIGNWTLEITVVHPLVVYPGIRVCQVYFDTVEGDITLYNGKYKDARGVQASRMFMDE